MKKLLASIAVIGIFLVYTSIKIKNDDEIAVLPKKNELTITPTPAITSMPINTPTSEPISPTSVPTSTPAIQGQYRDGEFTGNAADAFYGLIQVKAIISGGKIIDVQFLQYPNDRSTSIEINTQAMPMLKQEAIIAQNSNVDIISGATDSSRAFIESLGNALVQAK